MQAGTVPPPPATRSSAPVGRVPLMQRKIAGIPLPVVFVAIVAGAYLYIKHKNSQSASASGTNSNQAPVSTCVAVDQFGNCIESGLTPYGPYSYDTGGYGGYGYGGGGGGGSTPPATTTTTPAPVTTTSQTANNPYPVGTTVAPGEKIISTASDYAGGGGYDLTNLGGIYTYGNAPFLGSAYNPKGSFTGDTIVASPGGGYQINGPNGVVEKFPVTAPSVHAT